MKLYIVEGGDRLGKSTLISKICQSANYDNVTIRHFGKPPKTFPENVTPFEYQKQCFEKEGLLLQTLDNMDKDEPYNYYENIVIWNRSHLGEYVYGHMFRDNSKEEILKYLKEFEERYLLNIDVRLILLSADNPDFFYKQEDGKSLSKSLKNKEIELNLFNKVFDETQIYNKYKMIVNYGNKYKNPDLIYLQILDFLANETLSN